MSQPPTKLGPYEIIREIARSNDIVYEAYDGVMNRRVAVKELAIPPGSTSPQVEDRIARFRREAQAVGSLNHPHIMTVYSFAEDAGRWYIAMEFLDGTTLRKLIDDGGTIDAEKTATIVAETLDGLGHAHANGVVHRDIKPDNIQIVSSGGVKITDFGIARLTFQPNLTVDGQVFGTPSYMSPEQVVGRDIDARSDLFSVGAMMYEMLAGVKPFAGDNVVSITYNIVNTPAPRPANVTDALWAVIERALDKVPSSRYATAAEMRDAVQAAMRPNAAPPPAVPYVASTPWSVAPPIVPPSVGSPPPILGGPQYPTSSYPGSAYPGNGGAFPTVPNPYAMPASYTNAPIYYPPPPRSPVLSPEASRAVGRFLGIFVTIALIFAILFTVVQMIIGFATTKAAQEKRAGVRVARATPKVESSASTPAPATPVVNNSLPASGAPAAASDSLETVRQDCRNGDSSACDELRTRSLAMGKSARGTLLADAQSLYGESYAGIANHAPAVEAFLMAAATRLDAGAAPGEVRREIYAAEDEAAGDSKLEAQVAEFRRGHGLGDAVR